MKEIILSFLTNLRYFGTALIGASLYVAAILFAVAVIQPLLTPIREWFAQWGILPLLLMIFLIMAVLMAFIQTIAEHAGRWYE